MPEQVPRTVQVEVRVNDARLPRASLTTLLLHFPSLATPRTHTVF